LVDVTDVVEPGGGPELVVGGFEVVVGGRLDDGAVGVTLALVGATGLTTGFGGAFFTTGDGDVGGGVVGGGSAGAEVWGVVGAGAGAGVFCGPTAVLIAVTPSTATYAADSAAATQPTVRTHSFRRPESSTKTPRSRISMIGIVSGSASGFT
jgi:hypothetical protein